MSYFVHLGTCFDVVKTKRPCLVGCIKMHSLRIDTDLHWRPGVHILCTDPSIIYIMRICKPVHVLLIIVVVA